MKLAHRIHEAIDLDGHRPEEAKAYVRAKRIFETSLGRIIDTSNRMLKSLELMNKEDRKSAQGTVSIKSVKRISDFASKLKKFTGSVNGMRGLVGSNKKTTKKLIVDFKKATEFLDRANQYDFSTGTKKQINTYLDFLDSEFVNWEEAIKELL
jgi:hypothetical protein